MPRLVGLLALDVAALEGGLDGLREGFFSGRLAPAGAAIQTAVALYLPVQTWVLHHPVAAAALALAACAVLLLVYRALLLFWHNEVLARLAGTKFVPAESTFPTVQVDLLQEVARRPAGHWFVGLAPTRSGFRTRWVPMYISPRQRTMHRHVMGKTGSGKTLSVLCPSVLQDALDGKGVLVVDNKDATRTSAS